MNAQQSAVGGFCFVDAAGALSWLEQTFGDPHREITTANKMITCRQTNRLWGDFIAKFQRYAAESKHDDSMKLRYLLSNVSNELKALLSIVDHWSWTFIDAPRYFENASRSMQYYPKSTHMPDECVAQSLRKGNANKQGHQSVQTPLPQPRHLGNKYDCVKQGKPHRRRIPGAVQHEAHSSHRPQNSLGRGAEIKELSELDRARDLSLNSGWGA